ncbi:hypothetical protein B0919_14850 [Hymenobacter sp. CRA2]|nr:hypothetical protein B0919_14850 [Hymenobacter sp. CRA2]
MAAHTGGYLRWLEALRVGLWGLVAPDYALGKTLDQRSGSRFRKHQQDKNRIKRQLKRFCLLAQWAASPVYSQTDFG